MAGPYTFAGIVTGFRYQPHGCTRPRKTREPSASTKVVRLSEQLKYKLEIRELHLYSNAGNSYTNTNIKFPTNKSKTPKSETKIVTLNKL